MTSLPEYLRRDPIPNEQFVRQSMEGEAQQWMYDRYSLKCRLKEAGFQHPAQRRRFESAVSNSTACHLDAGPDGSVHKPDSLYTEAVRPAS
jgi:hypothetical protein